MRADRIPESFSRLRTVLAYLPCQHTYTFRFEHTIKVERVADE